MWKYLVIKFRELKQKNYNNVAIILNKIAQKNSI